MRSVPVFLVVLVLLPAACSGQPADLGPRAEIIEPSVEDLIEQFGVTPAELQDIQFIADEEGWTLSEALNRIAWQQGFAAFVQELRETYPTEFAGGAILGDTGARTVRIGFRSTVPAEVRADPRLQHLDVEFDEMLGFSEDDLSRQVIEVHQALLDAGFSDVASGPDIFTGIIDVAVVRREFDRHKTDQEILADLPALVRAGNVRIVFVDELPGSDD